MSRAARTRTRSWECPGWRGPGPSPSVEPTHPVVEATSLRPFPPNGSYDAYQTIPNYTLYPDTPEKNAVIQAVIGAGNVIFVDQETPLCTGVGSDGRSCIDSGMPVHTCNGIFADPRVQGKEIVSLACRSLGLADAGGSNAGVNAAQNDIGVDANPETAEWSQAAWVYFQRASSDDFWTYFQSCNDEQRLSLMTINPIRERLLAEGRNFDGMVEDPDLVVDVTDAVTDVYGAPTTDTDLGSGAGVAQCVELCTECGDQCRLYDGHAGNVATDTPDDEVYWHECPTGHRWANVNA